MDFHPTTPREIDVERRLFNLEIYLHSEHERLRGVERRLTERMALARERMGDVPGEELVYATLSQILKG